MKHGQKHWLGHRRGHRLEDGLANERTNEARERTAGAMTGHPGGGAPTPEPPPFDAAAYLEATAPLVGIAIPPGDRAAVLANLEVLAAVAADLMAQPLDDELELGPVFTA